MLLLNELLKIESVGDLVLREHVDLLLQKMTADDDDESCIAICGKTVSVSDLLITDGRQNLSSIYPCSGTIPRPPIRSPFPSKCGVGPQKTYIANCRQTITVNDVVTAEDL